MDSILSVFGEINDPRQDSGDSTCDRLNSRTTVFLLFAMSVVLTLKQHYIGAPIKCWHPDHFEESHEIYTDQLCWINNTYYLSFNESIPDVHENRKFIGYYQWTSIILAAMAVTFYIPRGMWMSFNKKSGIEITTITGAAIDCQKFQDSQSREKVLEYMVKHMSQYLRQMHGKVKMSSALKSVYWKFYGSYLFTLYMVVKIVYLANAVFMLILLDMMLGLRRHMHGFDFFKRLLLEDMGVESPLFPRIAYCDFQVRYLGNVMRYTVQCSLPINLFNEKIFIFVWFWLLFMIVATALSFLTWLYRYIYMPTHYSYVKTCLIGMEKIVSKNTENDHLIADFCGEYLRRDGILIIRLTAINSSEIVASEFLIGLWDRYLKEINKCDMDNNIPLENMNKCSEETLCIRPTPKQKDLYNAASTMDETAKNHAAALQMKEDIRNSFQPRGDDSFPRERSNELSNAASAIDERAKDKADRLKLKQDKRNSLRRKNKKCADRYK